MPSLGGFQAREAGGAEFLDVQDDVVGGEREDHSLRIAAPGICGSGRNGGRGIAAHRLDHDGRVDADILGLAAGEKAEIGARDDNRRCKQLGVGDTQQRLLIARTGSDQWQELLRQRIARDRPETGSGAAGQ